MFLLGYVSMTKLSEKCRVKNFLVFLEGGDCGAAGRFFIARTAAFHPQPQLSPASLIHNSPVFLTPSALFQPPLTRLAVLQAHPSSFSALGGTGAHLLRRVNPLGGAFAELQALLPPCSVGQGSGEVTPDAGSALLSAWRRRCRSRWPDLASLLPSSSFWSSMPGHGDHRPRGGRFYAAAAKLLLPRLPHRPWWPSTLWRPDPGHRRAWRRHHRPWRPDLAAAAAEVLLPRPRSIKQFYRFSLGKILVSIRQNGISH